MTLAELKSIPDGSILTLNGGSSRIKFALFAGEGPDRIWSGAIDRIGAFAATLGGLDTLVFAGGIGENAPSVRAAISDGLGFLGLAIDEGQNAAGAPIISADHAAATVHVIATDEEIIIARLAGGWIAPGSLTG